MAHHFGIHLRTLGTGISWARTACDLGTLVQGGPSLAQRRCSIRLTHLATSPGSRSLLFPFRGQTPCAGAPPFARLDRDFLQ
jgi:hypothetical protein